MEDVNDGVKHGGEVGVWGRVWKGDARMTREGQCDGVRVTVPV